MRNSQLIEVFRVLKPKERKLLGKYVRSPFFNTRPDVIKLYEYINDLYPFTKEERLSKSLAYKWVFPKTDYDEKKIRYTMSFLFKAMKGFFAYQEFLEEPLNEQLYLTRFFKNRGLERTFNGEVKNLTNSLEAHPFRTSNYHYKKYQLHYEMFDFSIDQKREATVSAQILSDEMTTFFIANKLKLSCSTLLLRNVSQSEYQQDLIDEVLLHVEANDYSDIPAIEVYYYAYKTLGNSSPESHFRSLLGAMDKYHSFFPKTEIGNIYLIATNFCIKQYSSGRREYLSELFDLYKKGLELDIYIEGGILSRFMFKNIVTAGLIERAFDWVESFIYDYKDKLEEKYRESTFVFNLANMHYYKLEYREAMELLREVVFDDILTDLAARCMLLKIYYESKEYEALGFFLDALKNFLYRHKEINYHKNNYLNLVKFTRRLININPYDKDAVKKLKMEIEKEAKLYEKDWLRTQVEKL